MKFEELSDVMEILNYYETKYINISNNLRLKNVEWFNEKTGKPVKLLEVSEQIIKDLRCIADVIYFVNRK